VTLPCAALLAGLTLPLALCGPGCTTKSQARREAQQSFLEGQRQVLAAQQQAQAAPQPVVWFRGLVRQSRIPWTEGLTLSQALAAAQYTGALDPAVIVVIRQGQAHGVDPRRLLRGEDDPLLLPGDLIEPRP
jgi:hypothetical protein